MALGRAFHIVGADTLKQMIDFCDESHTISLNLFSNESCETNLLLLLNLLIYGDIGAIWMPDS